mgnify:FL=1
MFANWLWSRLAADYETKILAFDPDDVIARSGLEEKLKSDGFAIIRMDSMDPIRFRYEYESDYRNRDQKMLYLVRSDSTYVPYDLRSQCYEVRLDFASLFPKLDISVLRRVKSLDLTQLYIAYRNDFGGYRGEEETWRFLNREMYDRENADEYAGWLEETIRQRLQEVRHYTDWFEIAKLWASLRLLQDGGYTQLSMDQLSVELDTRFQEWMLEHYKKLSASFHPDSPVLLHKTNDYVRTKGNKLALIVVDGMSLANWLAFVRADKVSGFSYQWSYAFALIPTITSVSRLAIFSGKLPAEMSKPFALAQEEKEWQAYWSRSGYKESEIVYQRGTTGELPSGAKVVGIVINTIDDIMHGQMQGRAGMCRDVVSWSESGELQSLILRLLEKDFRVFITSDHGNVEAIGQGRPPNEGVLTEMAGQRCRIYRDYADPASLEQPFRSFLFPPVYLPKNYQYVLCDDGLSFQPRGKKSVCHGGISLEEVIVPFIEVKGAGSP